MKMFYECMAVVQTLNEELENQLNDEEKDYFSVSFEFRTTGQECYTILLNNFIIWMSDFDNREMNVMTGDYEPLCDFVRREANLFISTLSKLKF